MVGGQINVWSPIGSAALLFAGLFAALPGVAPQAATVAAVFPPWWPTSAIMGAAGSAGEIMGQGASRFVLVVRSDVPALPARLRQAGAWLTLAPRGALGCGLPAESEDLS